jgi:NADH-quinone oxidoreductase subunit L
MTAKDIESILWLIPAIPLAASLLNGLLGIVFLRSQPKDSLSGGKLAIRYATSAIGITAIASSLVISLICLTFLIGQPAPHHGEEKKTTGSVNNSALVSQTDNQSIVLLSADPPKEGAAPGAQEHPENKRVVEVKSVYTWIPSGNFQIKLGFLIDPLTSIMLIVVCTISLLVHIFSTGYMKEDSGFHRFYTYLPFFTFSMLMLVLVNNFLWLYVFWEAVGLSSYLLIGFWFGKKYDWGRLLPSSANVKAFVVNRVGDFGFGLGIMWIFVLMMGPIGESYAANHGGAQGFDRLNYGNVFGAMEEAFKTNTIPALTVTLIALLLFMGAMGKSAQVPLHVWLPDAMAGPTPVSALIHAATMVTAGVYMVGRVSPIFSHSQDAMFVIAIIGVATAFFGSTVGLTQKDIKAVMAYSTVSQLGYMFFALGVFGWAAAFFHLMTHAFFKGLLFLGCGSVIHANEHAIHHGFHDLQHKTENWARQRFPNDPRRAEEVGFELFEAAEHAIEYGVDKNSKDELFRMGLDPQSMDYMGNLHKGMKITAICMTIAAAALAGVPFTAGFWSKDEILGVTFSRGLENLPYAPWYFVIYGLGIVAALFTAFYSFRMIFSAFWSKSFRLPNAMNKLAWEGMSRKAAELGIREFNPREVINFTDGYQNPQPVRENDVPVKVTEDGLNMTLPLVFLAFMSIAAGYVGLPNVIFGQGVNVWEAYIDGSFEPALAVVANPKYTFEKVFILLVVSGVVSLVGVFAAFFVYHLRRDTMPERLRALAGPLYHASRNKWYWDEIYNAIFVQGGLLFMRGLAWFDKYIIDGAVNGVAWILARTGTGFRKIQTGYVGNYALYMAIGLIAIAAIVFAFNFEAISRALTSTSQTR